MIEGYDVSCCQKCQSSSDGVKKKGRAVHCTQTYSSEMCKEQSPEELIQKNLGAGGLGVRSLCPHLSLVRADNYITWFDHFVKSVPGEHNTQTKNTYVRYRQKKCVQYVLYVIN